MLCVNFNAYASYVTDSLYQWDINQDLVINGLGLSAAPEIHFSNADMDRAIVRQSSIADGVIIVRIPNSLLQSALTIKAYVGVYEGETFKVIETIEIPVIARTKPADYTIEDSDEEIYSFNALENKFDNTLTLSLERYNEVNEKYPQALSNLNEATTKLTKATSDYTTSKVLADESKEMADESKSKYDEAYELLLTKNQIMPLFANSVDECADTTKIYVLPDGYLYAHMTKSVNPTNRLMEAIDSDGTPYNGGQGWKTGYYLPSVAGDDLESAVYEVTGFIPYKYTYTFRAKNLTLETAHSFNKINFYDKDFTFIKSFIMNSTANPMTQFVKDDGTVEGCLANSLTSNITTAQKQSIAYFRISCIDISDATLITINEPLETSLTTAWLNTGHAYQPTDYEDRIIDLEREVEKLSNNNGISLNSNTCSIFRKVVCCGDSMTAGYIDIGNGATETNENYAWVSFMERLTGNEFINCGASGATVLTWQSTARGLPKARTVGVVQAYIVGLGINDTSHVDLGTSADIGTENQTYYGGMSKIIRELNAISPRAKIFLQTMPTKSDLRKSYNIAIRNIVETYKDTYPVHLLDLEKYTSMYWDVDSITKDSIGGHYTAIAYQQFAENLRVIWSEYINSHISDFQDVYSIPYDTTN